MSRNKEIARRLSELRKDKGITQSELAEMLVVSRTTGANYETGNRTPEYDTLARLADIYQVSCDYIIRGISSEFAEIYSTTGLSEDAVLVLSILNKYEKDKKLLDTVNQLLENEYRTAYDLLSQSGENVAEHGFAPKLNPRKYSCCSQLLSKIAAYLQQPRRVRNHYLTDDGRILSAEAWKEEACPSAIPLDGNELAADFLVQAVIGALKSQEEEMNNND